MIESRAKYHIGQIIYHQLMEYRGVIIDVDPHFQGTEEWYKEMAPTMPDKAQPWYHVIVDGSDKETYVAESNLMQDIMGGPVVHPWLSTVDMDYRKDSNQYDVLRYMN